MGIAEVTNGLIAFILLLISLTFHEFGHAFVACKLGDPTPHDEGRDSINPLVHIDLFGTIFFPLTCIFLSTGILIGWARPVSVNTSYFRYPRFYDMLVGCAGIACNALLCFVAAFSLTIAPRYALLTYTLLQTNAVLIAFNLLPVPGLDGFHFVRYFFKISTKTVQFLKHWEFFILIFLINLPIVRFVLLTITNSIISNFFRLSTFLYNCFT